MVNRKYGANSKIINALKFDNNSTKLNVNVYSHSAAECWQYKKDIKIKILLQGKSKFIYRCIAII